MVIDVPEDVKAGRSPCDSRPLGSVSRQGSDLPPCDEKHVGLELVYRGAVDETIGSWQRPQSSSSFLKLSKATSPPPQPPPPPSPEGEAGDA